MSTPITLLPAAKGYRRSLFPGRAVSVYYDRHPPNEWTEHAREQLQLSVLLDEVRCVVRWKTSDGAPSELVVQGPAVWLIPSDTRHSLVCPEEADMVTLFLEREFAGEVAPDESVKVIMFPLAHLIGRDVLIGQLAKSFRRLCKRSGPANHLYVESIGTVLATHLLLVLLTPEVSKCGAVGLQDEALQRVIRYVDDHVSEQLHLNILGRAAGFSSSHFGRLFKNSLGMTPHCYVMRRRVAKAEMLLQSTAMKEVEIAELCGFSDDTLMARWFRRVLECLPSEIRNQPR